MDWYPWIKALHIISVIAFMAGMLYLPRLFVYHSQAPSGSPQSDTFSVMERRLLQVILNPALVLVWVTGLMLAYSGYFLQGRLAARQAAARPRPQRSCMATSPAASPLRQRHECAILAFL